MITILLFSILVVIVLFVLLFLLSIFTVISKINNNNRVIFWALLFLVLSIIFITILFFLLSPSYLVPYINDNPISTNSTSKTTTYYSYDPKKRTLSKLNLSETVFNKPLSDYFHKNDESLFVLKDGSIVSIIGNMTRKINSLPKTQKIRIVNGKYVALADGKIYYSTNLKNWTLDATKPKDVIDIDVPSQQTNLIHIQTPAENLIVDDSQNKILSSSKSETKKYGSHVKNFVRFSDSGVYLNDKLFQQGYQFAGIDHNNQIYLVPKNISGFDVSELHTSDNNAIVGLNTPNGPSKINIGDQIQMFRS